MSATLVEPSTLDLVAVFALNVSTFASQHNAAVCVGGGGESWMAESGAHGHGSAKGRRLGEKIATRRAGGGLLDHGRTFELVYWRIVPKTGGASPTLRVAERGF